MNPRLNVPRELTPAMHKPADKEYKTNALAALDEQGLHLVNSVKEPLKG